MMEKMPSLAGSGAAADVTGIRRQCADLLSRVDDFVKRVTVIQDSITHACQCCQLVDKVDSHVCLII